MLSPEFAGKEREGLKGLKILKNPPQPRIKLRKNRTDKLSYDDNAPFKTRAKSIEDNSNISTLWGNSYSALGAFLLSRANLNELSGRAGDIVPPPLSDRRPASFVQENFGHLEENSSVQPSVQPLPAYMQCVVLYSAKRRET